MTSANHHALPAFKMSILLCAGIVAGKQLPVSGGSLVVLIVLVALISLFTLFIAHRPGLQDGLFSVLAALLCFLGGAAKISADLNLMETLPDSLVQPTVVIGWAKEDASLVNGRLRVALQAEALVRGKERRPFRACILATVIPSRRDSSVLRLEYGMTVAMRGLMAAPTPERNPGEFSPQEYYQANGVSLLMRVRGADQVAILDSVGGSLFMRDVIVPLRRGMLALIDSTVPGEEGEFLKGLMIGDRSGMSLATRQAFTNSGVAHVLAVSGSNVAVVAGILMLVFEVMRIPGRARTLATLGGLLIYMMLTGSQPPVVRATIMATVFLLSRVFQRKSNPYNAIGVAALVVLGLDARQMFDVGFQLSFGAVLSIIHFYPKANAWIALLPASRWWQYAMVWLLRICAVSLVATLGTLPRTAVSFGRVSIVGIAANIVVIPAVELSVVLGFASACASLLSSSLAGTYAAVNELILHWTLSLATFTGGLTFAYTDTTTFAPIDSLPFYVGLLLLFNHAGRALARGLIVFLLSLNVAVYGPREITSMTPPGVMRVSFIDVGQGDAILAELPEGRNILVDAGPRTPDFDAGERIVAPFLKRRGVSTIDLFVITHGHNDHAGGAVSILKQFDVRRVAALGGLPRELRTYRGQAGDATQWPDSIRAGMSLMDSVSARVFVLYPLHTLAGTDADSASDNRCIVLKLHFGAVSFLLTADADGLAESEMVQRYGPFLQSTLLKAGHHGSSTSTTRQFLDVVLPEVTVISVGLNNRFRHPSPAVVQRLTAMCGEPFRTDEEGAVIFDADGVRLSRLEWR